MYKRGQGARRWAPVAVCAVTLAVAGGMFFTVPGGAGAGQTTAYLSGLLCAPDAALGAAKQVVDDRIEQEQPHEQPQQSQPVQTLPQQDTEPAADSQVQTVQPTQTTDEPAIETAPVDDSPMPEGMVPIEEIFYGQGTGNGYVQSGAGSIRNCTELSAEEIAAETMQALPFSVELNSDEPQVLIMHTHATESYETVDRTWCDPAYSARNTDTSQNMVAVGAEMARTLNAAGINTVQDATLHDYPSYNGSYEKSNATVRSYLEKYPSIKVVLDVHRDAIQREDGTRVKPVVEIDGKKAAQVMIICGADLNGNLPNFKQNLRFASRWQDAMETLYPGLARPVLFDYRYYNQDLTTGSLLIEMGGHGNTLQEAIYSARLVGKALVALFTSEAGQ
ncbi:stage II sporulation protein P [uncultured Ruthenibacterium sp.]|uniref:stage II sporulation protein P n=1 Tax=uncultured Ruthenibacterium sp. TaxID=1905347 RepID=UPI00349E76D3